MITEVWKFIPHEDSAHKETAAMKRIGIFAILFIVGLPLSRAQESVTLEECRQLAAKNYPVTSQYDLIGKLEEYNIANARRNWLPKISLSALASYLSEVPQFPDKLNSLFGQLGMEFGAMPNTQYGAAVQIRQPIWDGGMIKAQVEASKAESEVSRRTWEAEMYALRERVDQIYFGSLLLQENIRTVELLIEDLERNYKMLQALADFGSAQKNDLDLLRVEILGARQQRAQLESSRKAYITMLGIMTGVSLPPNVVLSRPDIGPIPPSGAVNRPELALFEAQERLLEAQRKALNATVMPQIGALILGAYSNPSPDIFKSMTGNRQWSPYFFAGISLKWDIDVFYTKKNRVAQIELQRRRLTSNRETFLYNIELQSAQERAAIAQMEETMRYDDEIITLRKAIRKRTEAQVKNGEGSVNDLLRDINAEDRARQNRNIHEVEWLKNIYDLKYAVNQ